jgi:hypothetical protein
VNLSYDVDLQALCRCASTLGAFSNPLPATQNIPRTIVDWAVEGSSPDPTANLSEIIWTAVHNMQMH